MDNLQVIGILIHKLKPKVFQKTSRRPDVSIEELRTRGSKTQDKPHVVPIDELTTRETQ